MKMLEDCIKEIDEKINFNQNDAQKELYKSIYYHLCDYKDILNKTIELNNEIDNISKRWGLVKKANENN